MYITKPALGQFGSEKIDFGRRTEEEPRTPSVGKIPEPVVLYITKADDIELSLSSTTCGIDGEQDGCSNTKADNASYSGHLQQPDEKISIERVFSENVLIATAEKVLDAAKQPLIQRSGPKIIRYVRQKRSRLIVAQEATPEDEE